MGGGSRPAAPLALALAQCELWGQRGASLGSLLAHFTWRALPGLAHLRRAVTRAHGCRGTPIQALNLVVDGEAGNSRTSRRAGSCGSPGRRRGGADPQPYPLLPCWKGRCGTACCPPQGWPGGGRGGLWTQGGGSATLKMAQISVQMTSVTPSCPLGARVLDGSGHGEFMERAQRGLSVTSGEMSLVVD